MKKTRTPTALERIQSYDGSGKPGGDTSAIPVCPLPKDIKFGDIIHFRDGQRRIVDATGNERPVVVSVRGIMPGHALMDGTHETKNREWDVVAVERNGKIISGHGVTPAKPPKTNPLAKKLSRIVCHDDPNRTMHLGVTCQLSMTVKEFNALMQRAAKALNGGRKP